MMALRERWRRDPGLVLLGLALLAAALLYAPTIGRGLLDYDDTWLVRDNWIVTEPSWSSLSSIWFDLSRDTRFTLGAEYLPIRDMSLMLDHLLWGSWYGGYHLTNTLLYLGAIAAWFAALDAFGVDRKVLGVMALLWALHPTHAESVAWVAERKGVLGAMFAGVAALGYARFRAGRPARWLVIAAVATVCAVWSKALSAFAIAALGGLELVLPAQRASWRRSLVGLGVVGVVGLAAFAPVVATAIDESVVGAGGAPAPAGWLSMALGILGFDLRAAALLVRSSPSYPIAIAGPSVVDIAIGAVGLVALIALAVVPARGRFRPPPELRAAAVLWLFTWFPSSRLVLPLKAVLVADRYLLLPTLGIALAIAAGITRIADVRARRALLVTIVLAASLRAMDAQTNWRDDVTLWQRAASANPKDGNAWSMYAESLMEIGRNDIAFDVIREGLSHGRWPRLLLRKALLAVWGASREQAIGAMRDAAVAGEPRAMMNLGLLLLDRGRHTEALEWAKRGAAALPMHAPARRALGKVALASGHTDLALAEFTRALELEPRSTANRYNMGLVMITLRRFPEAREHLEAALVDPALAWRAQKLIEALPKP